MEFIEAITISFAAGMALCILHQVWGIARDRETREEGGNAMTVKDLMQHLEKVDRTEQYLKDPAEAHVGKVTVFSNNWGNLTANDWKRQYSQTAQQLAQQSNGWANQLSTATYKEWGR